MRGIKIEKDARVISMAVLRHVEAEAAERAQYVRQAGQIRRAATGEAGADDVEENGSDGAAREAAALTAARYAELGAHEQFILTISQNGYGKRSSAYEYRTSGRGGKGIIGMAVNERNGPLIASFAVEDGDEIMLVTDGGQLIRVPVDGISILGRSTQGVTIFNTAEGEHVVSVEHITEEEAGAGSIGNGDSGEDDAGDVVENAAG